MPAFFIFEELFYLCKFCSMNCESIFHEEEREKKMKITKSFQNCDKFVNIKQQVICDHPSQSRPLNDMYTVPAYAGIGLQFEMQTS